MYTAAEGREGVWPLNYRAMRLNMIVIDTELEDISRGGRDGCLFTDDVDREEISSDIVTEIGSSFPLGKFWVGSWGA